jgi:hypothetical protein
MTTRIPTDKELRDEINYDEELYVLDFVIRIQYCKTKGEIADILKEIKNKARFQGRNEFREEMIVKVNELPCGWGGIEGWSDNGSFVMLKDVLELIEKDGGACKQ